MKKQNSALLFLIENDPGFVVNEVLADIDLDTRKALRRTGSYDRVIEYLCEMWLRAKPVSPLVAYVGIENTRNPAFSVVQIDQLAAATKTALETALQ